MADTPIRLDAASAVAVLGALVASAVALWSPPSASLPGSASVFIASLFVVTWGGAFSVVLNRRAIALACALGLSVVGLWQAALWTVAFPPAAAYIVALELRDRLGA
ncbi:hypothetical protein [Halarchaeum sp. P4]|uniref:hypothetical protein n=1 Tax=Halarchaeum sp. P4 TaxID=3421639 RepID=UPI003EBD444D